MAEPSPPPPSRPFKGLALGLFVAVLGLAVLGATGQFLFGSKFGPTFAASADALAGTPPVKAAPGPKAAPTPDAGAPDAASPPEPSVLSDLEGERFLGATKAGPVFGGRRARADAGTPLDAGPSRERFLGGTKAGPLLFEPPSPAPPSPAQQDAR